MSCVLRRFSLSLALFERATVCQGRRTLLSGSYPCHEAWERRLESPILQKIEPGDFAVMLQDKIDKTGTASAIDIDILANKLEKIDPIQIEFVQNIFHKFRQTNACVGIRESTPHAIVRAFISLGLTDRLLGILQNKVEYGIFLDYFTANILLDHFIESNQYKEAAQVAYELMLQEDFINPICRMLSWYACHKHWKNPPPTEAPEQAVAEDEEEDWVRVRFIERPWYDDHFDIKRDELLLGKTLTLVATDDDVLGRTYQLIGLALYEKFEKALERIEEWIEKDIGEVVTQEALGQLRSSIESVSTKEPPTEEKEVGLLTLDDVTPYYTEEQKETLLARYQELSSLLTSKDQIVTNYDMEEMLLSRTRSVITQVENVDINEQLDLFNQWDEERQLLLQHQIKDFQIKTRKASLVKRLKDLQEKEEKLSYFEQYDKIKIGIQKRPNIVPIEKVKKEELFVPPPQERGKSF